MPRSGEDETVLVVDDEADIVSYLVAALHDNGIGAVGVSDGRSAVEVLARTKPALVVLDVMMPEQSGLFVYRSIRDNPATAATPVMFITGCPIAEALARLDEGSGRLDVAGADFEYFEKPVPIGAFVARVRELLVRSQDGSPCG